MKDIVIENVGDTNANNDYESFFGYGYNFRKNVGINIIYNPGKVNLENITIRNVRTSVGFGVVSSQDSSETYMKNINIDMAGATATAMPIKVETTNGNMTQLAANDPNAPALPVADHQTIIERLTTSNVPNTQLDNIYVQDYRYKNVGVPDNYRYAVWSMSNGGSSSSAFNVFKEDAPLTATADRAIQDLDDGYWVVDANSSVTVNKQLSDILTVMNNTQNGNDPRAPRANIKIFAGEGKTIPSFTVPAGYANIDTNIVAIQTKPTLYSSTDPVKTTADINIQLPANNNGKIKLHNFDFHANAKYTMYEAVNGITPLTNAQLQDPADAAKGTYNFTGYPNYGTYAPSSNVAAKVTNSTSNSFVNCKFVVLADKVIIENKPTELIVGQAVDLNHKFTKSSTIGEDLTQPDDIDDKQVMWVSSDKTIATIDANGLVTPVAEGNVTLFLKAKDANNNGEIEKPFDSVTLQVKQGQQTYNLTTSVSGGHGGISDGEQNIPSGEKRTVTFTPEAGYEIDEVTVNGTETPVANNELTLTMDGNKNVVVTYKKTVPEDKKYDLATRVSGEGGTVSDGKTDIPDGTEETVTFNPADGYEIDKVTVNDTETPVADNKLTLTMDEENTVVHHFKKDDAVSPEDPEDDEDDSDETSTGDNSALLPGILAMISSLAGLGAVIGRRRYLNRRI